jgi:GAF domain-containing protein
VNNDTVEEPEDLLEHYLDRYVERTLSLLREQQCVLLLGPLGIGKSEVMARTAVRLEHTRRARAVVLNAAQVGPGYKVVDLLAHIVRHIGLKPDTDSPGAMREQIRNWMRVERRGVTLMLDHIEDMPLPADIFKELRALYQLTDADGDLDQDRGAGGFTLVMSSTQAWRRGLYGNSSPIAPLLRELHLRDCDDTDRKRVWNSLLRDLPHADRESLRASLDGLCGGDPHLIQQVGAHMDSVLQEALAFQRGAANVGETLEAAIEELRDNPGKVVPLLTRYGIMLDHDPDTFKLAMRLCNGDTVSVTDIRPSVEGEQSILQTGLFRIEGRRTWHFRSELARDYFIAAFIREPKRGVRVFQRGVEYTSGLRFLNEHRAYDAEHGETLRELLLDWVRDANTPSQAWRAVATTLSTWFNHELTLYRYHPKQQSAARAPDRYYLVMPERAGVEQLADQATESALQSLHVDLRRQPVNSTRRMVSTPLALGDGTNRLALMITPTEKQYGAVVFPASTFSRHPQQRMGLEFWIGLLNNVFAEITRFERDVLSNIDLTRVQRIVQEHRAADDTRGLMRDILSALTASFGLQFNRAAVFQVSGSGRLLGRVAIGHHTLEHWEQDIRHLPDTLEALRLKAPDQRTPLDQEVAGFALANYHLDPVLAKAMTSEAPLALNTLALIDERTALGPLFRIEPMPHDAPGYTNTAFVVPLRHPGDARVIGALVVDKPWSPEPTTQEQLDALPHYAAQLAHVLQNEEMLRRRNLFDRMSEFSTRRWSLQETLENVARAVLAPWPHLVTRVMLSIWETTGGRDNQGRPDRRRSTLHVAMDNTGHNLLREWHYAYYDSGTNGSGCVDSALYAPKRELSIPDLTIWHRDQGQSQPSHIFDGMRSVFSCALESDDKDIPRGVISFQSDQPDAFCQHDFELFRQIAQRASNVIEKARTYEGLSRARRNTAELNKATKDLIGRRTQGELHDAILTQARNLFTDDPRNINGHTWPDGAVLLAVDGREIAGRLMAHDTSDLAEGLARALPELCAEAMTGQPVFIEHAGGELVARERFGRAICARHADLGAQASVWTRIGVTGEMLLVLAWRAPRRLNHTERTALPLFTEIAARINGVLDLERERMQTQLASSLRVDDYAMIEAEFTHQWNKRVRAMTQYAQYAREDLEEARARMPDDIAGDLLDHLRKIERYGKEGIDRMGAREYLREREREPAKKWLSDYVASWNLLNGNPDSISCAFDGSRLSDSQTVETRPVILRWLLHELLINARAADEHLPKDKRKLQLSAMFNAERRELEISVSNNRPVPPEELARIRQGVPLIRGNNSGRGVWILGGQVRNLLGGSLVVPNPEDTGTRFAIVLPETFRLSQTSGE